MLNTPFKAANQSEIVVSACGKDRKQNKHVAVMGLRGMLSLYFFSRVVSATSLLNRPCSIMSFTFPDFERAILPS